MTTLSIIEEKSIKWHGNKRDLADRVLSGTDAAAALSAVRSSLELT